MKEVNIWTLKWNKKWNFCLLQRTSHTITGTIITFLLCHFFEVPCKYSTWLFLKLKLPIPILFSITPININFILTGLYFFKLYILNMVNWQGKQTHTDGTKYCCFLNLISDAASRTLEAIPKFTNQLLENHFSYFGSSVFFNFVRKLGILFY